MALETRILQEVNTKFFGIQQEHAKPTAAVPPHRHAAAVASPSTASDGRRGSAVPVYTQSHRGSSNESSLSLRQHALYHPARFSLFTDGKRRPLREGAPVYTQNHRKSGNQAPLSQRQIAPHCSTRFSLFTDGKRRSSREGAHSKSKTATCAVMKPHARCTSTSPSSPTANDDRHGRAAPA